MSKLIEYIKETWIVYVVLGCVAVAYIFSKAGPVNFMFMIVTVPILGPLCVTKNDVFNIPARIFIGICLLFMIAINFLGPELMQKFLDIITQA